MPKIKFDSFTYTIETENFNGECLANNLNIENKPLRKIKAILDFQTHINSKNYDIKND